MSAFSSQAGLASFRPFLTFSGQSPVRPSKASEVQTAPEYLIDLKTLPAPAQGR